MSRTRRHISESAHPNARSTPAPFPQSRKSGAAATTTPGRYMLRSAYYAAARPCERDVLE
jgi:hypothetical protein